MEIEGKGFVVKDRRSFDEKGELKGEGKPEEEVKKKGEKQDQVRETTTERVPLPEVNFNSLILSLSSSALLHLGEIADPNTGEKKKDTLLAKHAIDTMAMLKEKTDGNLTDEEKRFLESVLTDLQWRFVKSTE